MTSRRRVLVLAYFFPPLGGAGVQRTLKFVEYLAPLGWDATVISTRSRSYGARDESLLAEIPAETRVIRTRALPLAKYAAIVLHRIRLRRLAAYALWPDGGSGWAPFALLSALRAARRERPDVLFSSSAPYTSHLVAMLVARRMRVPWVADFRDEWAANPELRGQPRALSALAACAERAITRRAAAVVVAANYFDLQGLPHNDPRRVEIPNGVDEADFGGVRPSTDETRRFVLAHVGSIYGEQDPARALRVIAGLVARGAVDGRRLEVRLVGAIWDPNYVPPAGLNISVTGYVHHRRAIAEMEGAAALLLYVSGSSLAPSGKLYEYLGSGRPVLCLARTDNLASRLVSEWQAGAVADPGDDAQIERAFLELWRRWEAGDLPEQDEVRRHVFERYSRRAGAARLDQVLRKAADG
jgi:hypothetical protein